MQQTERIDDIQQAMREAFEGLSSGLSSTLVGIVEAYDKDSGTVSVQPSIETIITQADGSQVPAKMDLLVDIPVCYIGGGPFVATFPIQRGDEALVIFADRCIDSWWQSGGVQPPAHPRQHSLSDGIAIVGPRSLARKLANVSSTNAQLRTVDGSTYLELTPGGAANVVAPAGINLTGPVTIHGNLSVSGTSSLTGDMTLTGDLDASGEGTFNGITVSTHVHGGVQAGGSNTGGPIG